MTPIVFIIEVIIITLQKTNIPYFYFNGTHEDYHKATDTPDKIEYELLAKRSNLIFLLPGN